MNDSTNQETLRLKQLLEEVTAADTPSAGDAAQRPDTAEVRDAEGESLREAWLAFAQLIRAADASLPAIALATPQMATPLGPQKLHRRRWLALIAAAAAMLLVAVTFGWRTRGVDVRLRSAVPKRLLLRQPPTPPRCQARAAGDGTSSGDCDNRAADP